MGFSKKGAVESYFLITLILAIIGFGIVLYFLIAGIGTDYTEDEICKLSILTRATSPEIAQAAVPLKCSTKKICLTMGSEKCADNFAGERPEIIKLSGTDDEIRRKIEKTSADAMYDCWKMMGEGMLDLFGSFYSKIGLDAEKPVCVICARIAIDKSVDAKILEEININKYMEDTTIPELGVNYLSAFTNKGTVSYTKAGPVQKEIFAVAKDTNGKEIMLNDNKGNRELAIVFSQIKSVSVIDTLTNMGQIGGTIAGATFLLPIGALAKPIIASPIGGTLAVAGAVSVGVFGVTNAIEGQLTAAGYCGPFSTNQEGCTTDWKKLISENKACGCSIVQGINYNYKDINAVCPQIQGNL